MNNQIKSGKRPISAKPRAVPVNADSVFQNALGLDPEMEKVIASKGFAVRFINYRQFVDFGGSHKAHWKPIKRSQLKEWGYGTMDLHEFNFGSDADGYIRRGDLVLAVRPEAVHNKHKQYLEQEARRSKHTDSQHAQELRDYSRRMGLDAQTRVHEGEEVFED